MPDYQYYDQFISNLGNGAIDLTSDDIRMMLVNGYVFNSIHDEYSDVSSSEIAEGNGYIEGGKSMTGVTMGWDSENSLTKCDADNVTFTAVDEDMAAATGCIIYSKTSPGEKLICYMAFGEERSAEIDNDLVITVNGDGLLTIAEAE